MFKKLRTQFVIIGLLLSLSTPASARYSDVLAVEQGCLLGICATALCCALARAPAHSGISFNERSNLGLGILTAYMLANTALNVGTSIMDSYAKKDVSEDQISARDNYDAATTLSGLSAGLLLMATLGGIPEMIGPTFGSAFSFMALASSAGALAANAIGYNKIEGSTSSNEKSALVLSAVSVGANLIATAIHPAWAYYRRVHPVNNPS